MEQQPNRPPRKRRAAQACKSCRTRKVRCDLVATGFPPGCTNCKLDGITCELMGNKRRKTIHVPQDPSRDAVPAAASVHGDQVSDSNHDVEVTPTASLPIVDTHALSNGHRDDKIDVEAEANIFAHPPPKLPPYFNSLPSTVSSEDMDFLAKKGALSIPPRSFTRVILCRYVEFVHPALPLIDISSSITAIDDCTGQSGKISFLLLLAMIYAALPFVELKHVRPLGFMSKLDARTAYYKKIKLLYDLGVEPETLVLTQVTLLTSTPHGSMDPIQDAWYWIGLAISHAHSIGLHLDIGHSGSSDAKRKLRRRLWWCCYMREQVVAMGLGRPSRITHYNVPMLSTSDFELSIIPETVQLLPAQSPVARDVSAQQTLAVILIEKARLCVTVARSVAVMCKIRDYSPRSPAGTSTKILTDTVSCAKELESWASMLSIEATYDADSTAAFTLTERSIIANRASLHMIYYDTVCLLNRPIALAPSLPTTFSESNISQEESRRLIRWAAKELVRINSSLHELGLLSYLDATSVANVVAAVMVNLLDVKSEIRGHQESAIQNLQRCSKFLRVLKITYGSAIQAYRFLEVTLSSDGFPKSQKSQPQEPAPRTRMQSIEQLGSIFSPDESVANSSVNGLLNAPTPTHMSTNAAFSTPFFTEDFPLDDWLRGEDHWAMPNFGTMDLPMGYQI